MVQGCSRDSSFELEPVSFQELPGWHEDKILEALPALKRSCGCLLKSSKASSPSLKEFCQVLTEPRKKTWKEKELRALMQKHLQPHRVSYQGKTEGLFTGYYEPLLKGSKKRHGPYTVPLYRCPPGDLRTAYTRSEIVGGALSKKKLEIVWVDDPVAAFFLQVQGSGTVQLKEGGVLRLGYGGTNGKAYFPIGKALVDKGILTVEKTTLQSIRKWLKTHPKEAESVMSLNPSYVFFKERESKEGAIGSQGVPLTAQRSLAVDPSYVSLGTVMWVDINHPDPKEKPLRRLMVSQDTGGAIKGGIRGDFFWGFGTTAEKFAGIMKSAGHYFLLLPR